MVELFGFELVVAHHTPVVAGGVHRETRSEGSVDTNDHGILTGTAVPREVIPLHEVDHLPEAGVRVDHFISAILLLRQPLNCFLHQRSVISSYVSDIVVRVLEVFIPFEQGQTSLMWSVAMPQSSAISVSCRTSPTLLRQILMLRNTESPYPYCLRTRSSNCLLIGARVLGSPCLMSTASTAILKVEMPAFAN
jgi:hypothetical protein